MTCFSHLADRGHNRNQTFEFMSGTISLTLGCLNRPLAISTSLCVFGYKSQKAEAGKWIYGLMQLEVQR